MTLTAHPKRYCEWYLIDEIIAFFVGMITTAGKINTGSREGAISEDSSNVRVRKEVAKEELLDALKQNDSRLLKFCASYCHNDQEAIELRQEVVFQIWKAFPSFRHESKLTTWMYSIAMRTATAPLRNKNREKLEIELMEEIPEELHPLEAPVHDGPDVFRMLRLLDEIDRGIVILMWEGHSNKEIGQIIGLQESSIRNRLMRIRVKLKDFEPY